MNKIRTALLVMVLALTAACTAPEKGVVYQKKYHAAYTYTTWHCYSYNKQGICTLNMPQSNYVPESWELCLRDGEEEGCRSVDQTTYHKYRVGSYYYGDQ